MIEDKEILVEELEEHLQQVKGAFMGNPFSGVGYHRMIDSIEYASNMGGGGYEIWNNKRNIVETILKLT